MAFAIRHADHTGITVRDLERSIAFWCDVLGFEVERRAHLTGDFAADVTGVAGADISTAVIATPGHRIELLQYGSADSDIPAPSPDVPGSMHLAFVVDDLDDLVSTLARAAWTPPGRARTMEGGARAGTRFVYVRDPDGTTLEFIEPPAQQHR